MKTYTPNHFVLQEVLAAAIREASHKGDDAIVLTDDFVAPRHLAGLPGPLQDILRLLLINLHQSEGDSRLIVRPLLQTGNEVLIEFTIAHRNSSRDAQAEQRIPVDPAFMDAAEAMIKKLGGRSERIQLSGTRAGLKFILKWKWMQQAQKPPMHLDAEFSGKKVLIAEDNEVNGKDLCSLLRSYGIEADLVQDGKEAIETLGRKTPYDLLIMDLQMPHMDGVTTANYVRKKLKNDLPIIGLDSVAGPARDASCSGIEFSHCILKSTATEALPELLKRFIRNLCEVPLKKEVVAKRRSLVQSGKYRFSKTYKHTTLVHHYRPAS